MSKILYLPFKGSPGGGGPHIFVYKFAQAVQKRGYKIIYDKPNRADVALGIIESGKLLRKVSRAKTKVCVRIDGAYYKEYWHGGPGREWRPDMDSLHNAIKRDFNEKTGVDHVIFQSDFSRRMICSEIAKRDTKYSVIHNGVDTNIFKPDQRVKKSKEIALFHLGKIRNGYIIESLIGVVCELKRRDYNISLTINGSMDGECSKIYNDYQSKNNDKSIRYMGPCSNLVANHMFAGKDIYLGPRMGSSCDNVIVEALACGLPVVVPKWGGNSELLTSGKEGIVVDSGGKWNYGPEYIQRLADGVEQIIPDLQNYKIRARKHAEENLNIDTMVSKYLKAMGI